jgi:hypothetical protein
MSVATAMARKSPALAPWWLRCLVHRLVCRQLYVTTYMLRHSIANRDSLRACSNRIRGIFDVGTGDDGAAGQEQGAADVEVGVWAFWVDVLATRDVVIFYRLRPVDDVSGYASKRRRTVSF